MIRVGRSLHLDGLLRNSSKIAWVLFLISLPVTSFPYFPPALAGGTLVRPLAVYPLVVLLILVTLPRLIAKPLPKTLISFFPFVVVVLISSLLAALRGVEPTQGVTVTARMLRAVITLGLGSAIYLTVTLFPRDVYDLQFSLRWLYIGFAIALFWGSLQAVFVIFYSPEYFEWISEVQRYISIRKLFATRVSGLTYEPNWFAEQISLLLLPWLLAAVSRRYSVWRWRWHWVTIEWILLVWSMVVLVFTYSRIGLLIALVLVFLSVLFYNSRRQAKSNGSKISLVGGVLRRVLIAGLLVIILSVVILLAGTQSNYFSRIWRYWTEETRTSSYLDYIAFSSRLVYWQTAFNMFEIYPLLGVGLGNYAFHFEESLPVRQYNSIPEVLRIVTHSQREGRLITSKNLYARLLAETGLTGLVTFFAYVIAILGCALFLWFSEDSRDKFWGEAGLLGIVAFSLTAISTDSFSIPNMWVVFGLITAAAHVLDSNSSAQGSGGEIHSRLANGQDNPVSGDRSNVRSGDGLDEV